MRGNSFPSTPSSTSSCAFVVLLLAAGCRSASAPREPDARYEHIRPEYRAVELTPSREWIRASFGWLARDTDSADPIGDGFAFGLEGGFDLATTTLTPSIEIGGSYTSAHVSGSDSREVDVARVYAGLRGTWYAGGWRPHVSGGGFVRDDFDDLDEPLDPYATGVYVGAGIDWEYDGMWLGPSLTYWRALEEEGPGGEAEEWTFALSATFRL